MTERWRQLSWRGFSAYLPRARKYGVMAFLFALLISPLTGHPLLWFAFGAALWAIGVWLVTARMLQIEALAPEGSKRISSRVAFGVLGIVLIVILLLVISR